KQPRGERLRTLFPGVARKLYSVLPLLRLSQCRQNSLQRLNNPLVLLRNPNRDSYPFGQAVVIDRPDNDAGSLELLENAASIAPFYQNEVGIRPNVLQPHLIKLPLQIRQ